MEYVQERVATLHDYGEAAPPAPTDRATVVVPMTERDYASLAAERVFETLSSVGPATVLVALRADADQVGSVRSWLDGFDLDVEVLWCNAPPLVERLRAAGLAGTGGKGRDVWLALGLAATDTEFVAVHDADTKSYAPTHVPRLLFPLAQGYSFSKGYYARVENGRLYGRLNRLFYVPLVRALAATTDAPVVEYLGAFRYALAGEAAMTADLARRVRAPPGWGLEVGTLGTAFREVGFEGSAQVDLGQHEHEHRSVGGPNGLGDMCLDVADAVSWVLADAGVDPDYDALRGRYRAVADRLVDQYAADAAFNGLSYDPAAERDQVETYAGAVTEPAPDDRLPAWADAPLVPEDVRALSRDALEEQAR